MNQSSTPQASNAESKTLLLAQDLRKTYGSRVALQRLSFSLNAGRVLGFLGPNGAGKTTSIRILTTILEPTSGHFFVDGTSDEHPEEIRRKIGVLPESLGFPKQTTAAEYLTYYGQLFGRTHAEAKANTAALLEDVGMTQRANSLIGTYSHGMRQRIGIARALVNNPVVIFLDEPTLGLDPKGQQELLSLIQRIARERNVAVVLCSHHLSEIEGICDDVVIMSAGHVVATGSVSEVIGMAERNVTQRYIIRIRVPSETITRALQILETTPSIANVMPTNVTTGWLAAELDSSANGAGVLTRNTILEALIHAEIPILSFESAGGRLQDVFLQLTAEAL
jgi:ABC-2 type transport system ATP-binding protein